jgi:hypothetical protein
MPEIPFDALNQFQRRLAEFTLLITFADFYRRLPIIRILADSVRIVPVVHINQPGIGSV